MLPVANRPILEYVIEALKGVNIRKLIIIVGYRKERIMSYFGNGDDLDVNITYVTQRKQLGTAHALAHAKNFVGEEFLVLPGDNIILHKGLEQLLERPAPAGLITEHDYPSQYGVVTTRDGYLSSIVEKPETMISRLISTGIFRFCSNVFDYIDRCASKLENDITQVIDAMLEAGETIGIAKTERWLDVVYPWDLLNVNEIALETLKEGTDAVVEQGVIIKNRVGIGVGTTIRGGCYIEGPAIIGEGCDIGPTTVIYPGTSIGDNVTIGPMAKIKRCVVRDDVSIMSHSSLTNCVIGEGASLGANFVAESGPAEVITATALERLAKVGAVIGEDSRIGNNVVIEPGVIVGAKCKIASLRRIDRNIFNGALVL